MKTRSYRSILVENAIYDYLKELKDLTESSENKKMSFGRFLQENLNRKIIFFSLDDDLVNYITNCARLISKDSRTIAIVLFGSVAKGRIWNYSDIDLLVVAEVKKKLDFVDEIRTKLKSVESMRETLVKRNLFLRISPLVLTPRDLETFSPFYLDILDYGIPLFQRDATLDKFFTSLRRVQHERIRMSDGEALAWGRQKYGK